MHEDLGHPSRRDFLKGAAALLVAPVPHAGTALEQAEAASSRAGGAWSMEHDLPVFDYTGTVPLPPPPGVPEGYRPSDPYFLLGNYRLTLLAHTSGLYQLLTGERAWGRMNQGDTPWSGQNSASVRSDDGKPVDLVGLAASAAGAARKRFGVGFAEYTYTVSPALRVTRTLSVAPSAKIHEGISGFVLSVNLQNKSDRPMRVTYTERIRARYAQIQASFDSNKGTVRYRPVPAAGDTPYRAVCAFQPEVPHPLTFPPGSRSTPLEAEPPALYMELLSVSPGASVGVATEEHNEAAPWIGASANGTLKPGEEMTLRLAVGYTRDGTRAITTAVAALKAAAGMEEAPYFRDAWHRVLPSFAEERDQALRREMRWNAAVLEQMATWKQYYNETLVPQGMTYDYEWGRMLSSRDWAQHALPLCHTNPALARSVLRLIMKRTRPDGEIELNDQGFGWSESGSMRTSDQQLFFFMLLNEYLRVTHDVGILTQTLPYHPAECSGQASGFEHVLSAFLFLRDRIGTGPHGLLRLWNSDWNDLFYSWPTGTPYNDMFNLAESHMNTAVAIVILGDLAAVLGSTLPSAEAAALAGAVQELRAALLKAFLADWGSRAFPRRAYLGHGQAVGEDEMWLEPQPYALLIPEVTEAKKHVLWREINHRLLSTEAMGARQIESPKPRGGTPPGTRENGGFWFALNGPLVLGLQTFDPALAAGLFERLTLAHYTRKFPQFWTGQWTAPDALDSSLTRTEGLSNLMPYCAHAHAWPLYCYLRLHEPMSPRA